jgi:two-component system, LytTR family, sensor kinase
LISKYALRTLFAILIFMTLRLSDSDDVREYFNFSQAIDQVMFVYSVLIVLLIWELIDRIFYWFRRRNFNFTRNRNLARAGIILTILTIVPVYLAVLFAQDVIKPLMNCPISPEEFYREVVQAQAFAWLIISMKIIRENSIQNQRLESDKALVQKELLQTKYENLKNQINPHFLFNSFSVLQNLIDTNPRKASEFLEKLSAMFRYILEKREQAMSSVDRELEILDVYMFLMRTRHGESLQLKVDIDEHYRELFIPTLSLQMLIENAIKHNKFSESDPLEISLFIEDEYLVVQNQIHSKTSDVTSTKVGLENIRNRYGLQTDRSVVISTVDDRFTVKLPVLRGLRLT